MSKEILIFGDIEIEKNKFYRNIFDDIEKEIKRCTYVEIIRT